MNQSESNPLRRELARGRHDGPHPDADLLTALGEGSLLQVERQRVLAHIAGCAECRETLSITAAALESTDDSEPVVVTRASNQPQRAWLPWASVAAGFLVACSAVLVYQQRTTLPKNTEIANKEPAQLPLSSIQVMPPSVERKEISAKAVNSPATKQLQVPVGSLSPSAGNEATAGKIELTKKFGLTQRNSYEPSTEVSAMEPSGAPALKAAQAPPSAAFANTLTERAMSAASVTAAVRPHWRINSMGQAERAYGAGAWQPVLPLEQSKMRVISVIDRVVWIGGENSRLYRSTDNGASWMQVSLPEKDGRERSIAHIHFQTEQAGTVESDDGTVWTTSDGGSTWK